MGFPSEGALFPRPFQTVAVARDSRDPVAPAELRPEPAYEQVDALGGDVVVAVYLVQDLPPRKGDPGVADEVLEEAEFEGSQGDRQAPHPGGPRDEVDLHVTEGPGAVRWRVLRRRRCLEA